MSAKNGMLLRDGVVRRTLSSICWRFTTNFHNALVPHTDILLACLIQASIAYLVIRDVVLQMSTHSLLLVMHLPAV